MGKASRRKGVRKPEPSRSPGGRFSGPQAWVRWTLHDGAPSPQESRHKSGEVLLVVAFPDEEQTRFASVAVKLLTSHPGIDGVYSLEPWAEVSQHFPGGAPAASPLLGPLYSNLSEWTVEEKPLEFPSADAFAHYLASVALATPLELTGGEKK